MRDSATHRMAYRCVNYRSSVAEHSGEGWFISVDISPKGANSPSATPPVQPRLTDGTSFAPLSHGFATTSGELS